MATVPRSTRSTTITLASASAGPFDLDFRLFDDDGLEVFVNYLPRTDWTLSSSYVDGYDDDASVTFDAALSIGDVITINSSLYPVRADDYINGPSLTNKMNVEQGRVWAALSDQRRDNKRSMRTFQEIDPVRLVANKALMVNAAGDGFEMGPTADDIENAQSYAEAALAAISGLGTYFNTVADMVADEDIVAGMYVQTRGRLDPDTGGGGIYKIVTTTTRTVDGGSCIQLTGITGYAELQGKGPFSPAQWAAPIDGTDASDEIQAMIDWGAIVAQEVYVNPDGNNPVETPIVFDFEGHTYGVSKQITLAPANSQCSIINGGFKAIAGTWSTSGTQTIGDITVTLDDYIFKSNGATFVTFRDLKMNCNGLCGAIKAGARNTIWNCTIMKIGGVTGELKGSVGIYANAGNVMVWGGWIRQWDQNDVEYYDKDAYNAIGIFCDDSDLTVYGTKIYWCYDNIIMAGTNHRYIYTHSFNGMRSYGYVDRGAQSAEFQAELDAYFGFDTSTYDFPIRSYHAGFRQLRNFGGKLGKAWDNAFDFGYFDNCHLEMESDSVFFVSPRLGSKPTSSLSHPDATYVGQTDTFDGDGIETDFSVDYVLKTADLTVKVGGVTKTLGADYTVSGSTVTFAVAPASGSGNVKLITADRAIGTPGTIDFWWKMYAYEANGQPRLAIDTIIPFVEGTVKKIAVFEDAGSDTWANDGSAFEVLDYNLMQENSADNFRLVRAYTQVNADTDEPCVLFYSFGNNSNIAFYDDASTRDGAGGFSGYVKFGSRGDHARIRSSLGSVIIANSLPDLVGAEGNSLVISTGDSGVAATGADADDLIIENNDDVGITLASAADKEARISVHSPSGERSELRFDMATGATSIWGASGAGIATCPDRATLVTAKDAFRSGVVVATPDGIAWVKDGGTSISDMSGWSPFGDVYPDHFATNTTPGTTDMGQAIIDAMAFGPTKLRRTIYATSVEIPFSDGYSLVGESPFWKRRTGYAADASTASIIKFIGSTGSNTCVVRISEKAVGVVGSDFSGAETDDIINVTARDFHVDAGGADYGFYLYRAGNQSTIGNLTAEGAARACHIHLGCYAANFGTFGAFECADVGVICGYDEFAWGSVEATNFAYIATYLIGNNGTAGTFVKGTATDLDGCGAIIKCGRGSHITITSEGNDGRAFYAEPYSVGGGVGGSLVIEAAYLEGNTEGPKLVQPSDDGPLVVQNGFVHPLNDIEIEAQNSSGTATDDEGPDNPEQWLLLKNLHGGFDIDSNTDRYRMESCGSDTTFTDRLPSEPFKPFVNEAINGDFSVWQRGTSFSADGYSADRWYLDLSGATGTVTRQALTAGSLPGYHAPSPSYYAEMDVTTGNADAGMQMRLADVTKYSGRRLVISCWVKADTLKTFRVDVIQNFGSGGSSSVTTFAEDWAVPTGWRRMTAFVDVPSVSGKTIGSDNYIAVRIRRTAADTFTLDLAAFAIEDGEFGAACYVQKQTGQEMSACHSYFQRFVNAATGIRLGFSGQAISTTASIYAVQFLQRMRKTPTLSASAASHFSTTSAAGSDVALSSLSLSQANEMGGRLVGAVASGLVAGNATLVISNSASATLDFVAEV